MTILDFHVKSYQGIHTPSLVYSGLVTLLNLITDIHPPTNTSSRGSLCLDGVEVSVHGIGYTRCPEHMRVTRVRVER
jgi:hypothetical protein